MAKKLSKAGIVSLNIVRPGHVSQSVDAFTGIDDYDTFDRYNVELHRLGEPAKLIDSKNEKEVNSVWQKMLERQ